MGASHNCKQATARSFGGLRMTVKRGRRHPQASTPSLSSYVCKPRFKRQNSQILRRPQDDSKRGEQSSQSRSRRLFRHCIKKGLCIDNHPVNVILRPPKDLAVLSLYSRDSAMEIHHRFSGLVEAHPCESATARSFGGLRMTEKVGGSHPMFANGAQN